MKNAIVRELERRLMSETRSDTILEVSIKTEAVKCYNILKCIIDVVLFLGERDLAFTGSSHRIGDSNNGNFLGLIEVLFRCDPILQEHVLSVEELQKRSEQLQVHYLSPDSQNEFIAECSNLCREEIAQLITDTLKEHVIPLSDCRAQAYDNVANVTGKYNGAQAKIQEQRSTAIFSPCGCHTLNLCGNDAAECTPEAITLFGTIQTVYHLFSSSPKQWGLLQNCIGCSLHDMSETRWSDRVECVKPFAAHLRGIKLALKTS
ncbi:uncharacterized protein LOC106465628 [Limulus polyphemus]|uniref:Uncharacterized protein LOC106465628 n=1 Tax=Limulus polyphemus TaxID=6850 RepID=A0ABM1BG34_LIMPO|nr:uncharacterized protein LOC106465628 [Limulus polyphemus]